MTRSAENVRGRTNRYAPLDTKEILNDLIGEGLMKPERTVSEDVWDLHARISEDPYRAADLLDKAAAGKNGRNTRSIRRALAAIRQAHEENPNPKMKKIISDIEGCLKDVTLLNKFEEHLKPTGLTADALNGADRELFYTHFHGLPENYGRLKAGLDELKASGTNKKLLETHLPAIEGAIKTHVNMLAKKGGLYERHGKDFKSMSANAEGKGRGR